MGSLLDNSIQVISRFTKDTLFVRIWPISIDPKGIVYIVHELGAHCLLYDDIANMFNEAGYIVAANDHFGHGLSGGTKLHVSNYQIYINDTVQCLQEVATKDTEVTLFGHGVGGLLSSIIAYQNPELVSKLILHAPVFRFKDEFDTKLNMCWYLSYVFPYMYSPYNVVDPEDLIANEVERKKYVNDPWIWQDGPRLSILHAILSAMQQLKTLDVTCKTLIQYGSLDTFVDVNTISKANEKTPNLVKIKCYDGGKHYLHLDTTEVTKQVLEDMAQFCENP